MSELVKQASAFAHAAHAARGQKRKYTGDDYIVHPHNVAEMVAHVPGSTVEMQAAAWLHDVVQDCGIELGMIQYFFGPTVTQYVGECSHVDHANDPRKLNRSERMAIELARAADISPQAKTIKLADLLDNTATITQHDPNFAVIYMAEKRRLILALIGGDAGLWDRARHRVQTYYALQGVDAFPSFNLPQKVAPQPATPPAVEPSAKAPFRPSIVTAMNGI
jgi:(p)ppGpp synthase/HD superfamily hydrolase